MLLNSFFHQVASVLDDAFLIDFVHSHKVFVQTDGAEFVLQAEAFEGARNAAFAENFRNRAAEAADDAVVFNGDNTAGF